MRKTLGVEGMELSKIQVARNLKSVDGKWHFEDLTKWSFIIQLRTTINNIGLGHNKNKFPSQ